MNWTLISAVSNQAVLNSCLLSSPELGTAQEIILKRGYSSVALAFNAAIDEASADLLVFAHQDMYLPAGWIDSLRENAALLSAQDPNWGVLGVWGVKHSGDGAGFVYCGATRKVLGCQFDSAVEVETLDEVILILRKSAGLRFDDRLPGFHMYAADLCMEARRRGMKCYAISAFCVHNTNGYSLLPFQFWRNYFFMRRKWKSMLPISTSCAKITFWCWPMIWWNIDRVANLMLGRHKVGKRVQNSNQLYQQVACPVRINSIEHADKVLQ